MDLSETICAALHEINMLEERARASGNFTPDRERVYVELRVLALWPVLTCPHQSAAKELRRSWLYRDECRECSLEFVRRAVAVVLNGWSRTADAVHRHRPNGPSPEGGDA
jgi:hypothetical protein